nr:zinc ribbon domain-containing protein [Chloroflexota bacterium]
MPIYEFRCQACGAKFEVWLRTPQDVVACPACGATLLEKQVSAPAVVGTRSSDEVGRTCCGREERCERPPCSDGGNCYRQ